MCIRDVLFQNIAGAIYSAAVTAGRLGVLSGVPEADAFAASVGVCPEWLKGEGGSLEPGDVLLRFAGDAKQIALMEEGVIGLLAKYSGIAAAARRAVSLAAGRAAIVSGAWKKMPAAIKEPVRNAVAAGGARFRISDAPMIYLDKNSIRMLGSIPAALAAAAPWPDHVKVVQVRGEGLPIALEAAQAVDGGCGILMVDTGRLDDLRVCLDVVARRGRPGAVRVAFAGDVAIGDVPALCGIGPDIICIGKEIVDARLLDMRLDVIGVPERQAWA